MQNRILIVNREPYLLWGYDLDQTNLRFLEQFDVDYFDYCMMAHLESEDDARASVALRFLLLHATETLYSVIGATLQAPQCAYAWLSRYSNQDLRDLITRINLGGHDVTHQYDFNLASWENIAGAIFRNYEAGTEKQARTIEQFARLWRRMSSLLLDAEGRQQYNALKHGLRGRKGGFGLAVGSEETLGVEAPPVNMKSIGYSPYGMSIYKMEPINEAKFPKEDRSVRAINHSYNWSLEQTVQLLQLTCMSINNVVSGLRAQLGAPPATCKFVRPEADDGFDSPWQHSVGVTSCSFNVVVDTHNTQPVTKEQLLDELKQRPNRSKKATAE
jgi:hypothetical protein